MKLILVCFVGGRLICCVFVPQDGYNYVFEVSVISYPAVQR